MSTLASKYIAYVKYEILAKYLKIKLKTNNVSNVYSI